MNIIHLNAYHNNNYKQYTWRLWGPCQQHVHNRSGHYPWVSTKNRAQLVHRHVYSTAGIFRGGYFCGFRWSLSSTKIRTLKLYTFIQSCNSSVSKHGTYNPRNLVTVRYTTTHTHTQLAWCLTQKRTHTHTHTARLMPRRCHRSAALVLLGPRVAKGLHYQTGPALSHCEYNMQMRTPETHTYTH